MNNGKDLILSCLFIIASICFKLNFSVVLIAYLLINLFQNKSIKHKIIATLLFVTSYVLSKNIVLVYIISLSVTHLVEGVPILTYFVMGGFPYEGMQRSVQSIAGEWNGYTTSLAAATNVDSKVMSSISLKDFITQIKYILSITSLAFDFYKNKILYTWSVKDFASLDALNNYGVFAVTHTTSNDYLLFSNIYILFCNVVHYMVFLCLSISAYKQFKNHNWFSNVFSLIFIGFFAYHLISESKGMYVMPVVYLMIPLVAYEFSTINYGDASLSKTNVIIGACIIALMFVYNCTRYTVEAYQNNIDDTVTFETIKAGESVTQSYRFSEDIRLDNIKYTISSDVSETNSGQYQLYINDSLVDSDTFVTDNNEAIITLKRPINKNDTLTLKIINTNSYDLYIQTSSVENDLVESSS